MTNFNAMAQECRSDLVIVSRQLEKAKARFRESRTTEDRKAVNILEEMSSELRCKVREYDARTKHQEEYLDRKGISHG